MGPGQGAGRGAGRRRGLAAGLGAALVVGAGVVAVDLAGAPGARAATLAPFDSCEELVGWYRDATLPHVTAYGLGGGWAGLMREETADASVGGGDMATAEGAAQDGAAATGGAVGSSGTGTNVQETGVDEPSRVKTADGLAYVLSGERLVVVDLAEAAVRGEVTLAPQPAESLTRGALPPQRWFGELLLVDDRVVVLGSGSLPVDESTVAGTGQLLGGDAMVPWGGPSTTTATTVDVSDPAAPVVLDVLEIEGSYVSARASGGDVRLVTGAAPSLPFADPWLLQEQSPGATVGTDPTQAPAEAEALAYNQQLVRDATAADWLPDLVRRDEQGRVVDSAPVDCSSVSHPATDAGSGTVTVVTLDPAAGTLGDTTSVSADGSIVYASTDRLYVATTSGGWLWGGQEDDVTTDLHGFDTSGGGRTDYLGSGSVDGWLMGSWALDAHEGHLRVGTTDRAPAGPGQDGGEGSDAIGRPAPLGDTSSSVVVLREGDGGLTEVGRVDGLGPGEQIRSLRWFDGLAVVVTFEQTDPLYTVDLTDPASPALLGELKVLGYSGYLHPLGDGLLLGVGQDGTEDGRLLGAKVETYDVRDLAAPTDVASLVWPDSSSAVEWDSRLFAYLPGRRTAVMQLERYGDGDYATGLVAVTVGPDGSVTESGSWLRPDGGWVGGLATTEGLVLVTGEVWQGGDGEAAPATVLTVLTAADLEVLAHVELG